jgi:hypothetical protein
MSPSTAVGLLGRSSRSTLTRPSGPSTTAHISECCREEHIQPHSHTRTTTRNTQLTRHTPTSTHRHNHTQHAYHHTTLAHLEQGGEELRRQAPPQCKRVFTPEPSPILSESLLVNCRQLLLCLLFVGFSFGFHRFCDFGTLFLFREKKNGKMGGKDTNLGGLTVTLRVFQNLLKTKSEMQCEHLC